jgi:hypothetical protein
MRFVTTRFQSAARPHPSDLRLLQIRDRALLRLVNRGKGATTSQLARLSRTHRRKIQQRTRLLWLAGYLERTALPIPYRGGSPLAYRLSPAARHRLGYRDRRTAGIAELQHRLDTVETVAALSGPDGDVEYPVQAWLAEPMARGRLGSRVHPDSIVVIQLAGGSAVLCLETDEATQHWPVIRGKLGGYREALNQRSGWHLLFVVPSAARRSWLLRQARESAPTGSPRGWVCELALLTDHALDAPVWALGAAEAPVPLRSLIVDRRPRRCSTPVGGPAWLDLLGSGGGEDFSEAVR